MQSLYAFAKGSTLFYDPADPVYFMGKEERKEFDAWVRKGAPIGVFFFVLGLAAVIAGVLVQLS